MLEAIIIIIFVLLIMASLAIVTFVQLREKMRLAKIRRITSLESAYQRVHRLMAEIPPQYLSQELRLLLAERAVEVLSELKTLQNDSSLDAKIAEDKQLLQDIIHKKLALQPTRVNTPARVTEIRHLLEALYRFVDIRHKSRKIESRTANNYLKYILYLIHRSRADLSLHEARIAIKQKQLRHSIHHHHAAIAELSRCKDYPLAQKTILDLSARIQEMLKEVEQQTQSQKAAQKNLTEAIDKEWDKFSGDDATWKKKNQYDE